jgi:bifunctional oligoribonuclease and PAP phosphatase NrnA
MHPPEVSDGGPAAAIARGRRVLIIAHVMPDGDAIGSALGLAWGLRKLGIDAQVACADPVPEELRFLPGADEFAEQHRPADHDILLVVDASDIDRIGDLYDEERFAGSGPLRATVINIDHHVTNTHFADLDIVEPRSSTAELVLDLLLELGVALDETIATCLLTGIVTDTRCFRTSNTTAATMRAAMQLMEAGASLSLITDAVFSHRPIAVVRLWGPALKQATLSGGVLWTEISQELLQQTRASEEDTSGLVNFLIEIHEARVAVVLREMGAEAAGAATAGAETAGSNGPDAGAIDVSIRARPGIDVSGVALRFGGGGHPQAAGCQVVGALAEVRQEIVQALQEVAQPLPEAEERARSGVADS